MNEPELDSTEETARKCVLVLGMHRSGTSALSGLLNVVGCDQPKTPINALKENPKGFFESKPLKQLDDEILASDGSAWHDWTEFSPVWFDGPQSAEFHARALEVIHEEFGASPLFVLKDPRICRLAPFWFRVLKDAGCSAHVVHIHRNPLEVAASLNERNGFDIGYGLLLWLRHVLDAETASRGYPRHFVSYPEVLANPSRIVAQTQKSLGLRWPRRSTAVEAEIDGFISPDLRHFSQTSDQVQSDPAVSQWVRESFDILERWAAEGEDSADHAELDAIRAGFNAAAPMFAPLTMTESQAARATKKMAAEMAEAHKTAGKYKKESAGHLAQIKTLEADLAAATAAQEDGQTRLAAAQAARSKAEAEVSEARALIQQRQTELTAAQASLEQTCSNLARRTLEAEQQNEALRKLRTELAAAENAGSASQAASSRLQVQLRGAKEDVAERFEELGRLTAMLIAAERKTQAAAARAAEVEAHRNALLISTSWRITGPLRRLVDLWRGVRRRG